MMFHFSDPLGKIPNVADMESKDLISVIEIESVVSKITGLDLYKHYYPSGKILNQFCHIKLVWPQ